MKKSILSIFIILLISGIFFIYQGFSYQKKMDKKKSNTLESVIINNNNLVKDNGLIKENDTYYFKGETRNNYVKIFNRLYRIISIKNKKVKIVSNNNEAVFYYGNGATYIESNIYKWLNKTEQENTGIYYNSIPGVENLLIPTEYCINTYIDSKVNCSQKEHDYFSILTIEDYLKTGAKKSFLNNGTSSYILGYDEQNKILNKEENGSLNVIDHKASGIRVVMTLKKNIKIKKGTGTFKDPYIIDQENNENDINKYVQLGDDLYQIIEEKEEVLKLRLSTYLKEKKSFNNKLSGFNPLNKNNIAYYLNNEYYHSLSYKDSLTKCKFLTGELKEEQNYLNIYTSTSSTKIGLPNIFDLNISNYLTDYYLINTNAKNSNTAYVYNKFGTIIEEKTTTLNKIIPVICLNKKIINDKGTGTEENPYITD